MRRIFSLVALLFISNVVWTEEPAVSTEANLLKKTAEVESWRFEQHEEGKGEIAVQDDGILFKVETAGVENWHVQALQTDLDLRDGQEYTVKFKASSPNDHVVILAACVDQDDYHSIGLHEEIYTEKDLKEYEFTFTASETVEGKNRLGFVLSTGTGAVIVKDLVLAPSE